MFCIPRHKKRAIFRQRYLIKDNVLGIREFLVYGIFSSRIDAKPFNCIDYRRDILRFEEELLTREDILIFTDNLIHIQRNHNLVGDSGLCVNIADTMTFVSITAYSLLAIANLADYPVDFIET